jgi:predicted LPLAT superfamily acyltransferase
LDISIVLFSYLRFLGAPGQSQQSDAAISFVLECLQLLPLSMAHATANKVFLEPLSQVLGVSHSKDLILQSALKQHNSRIFQLGILLGM